MFFLVKTRITVPISPEKLDPSKDIDKIILDTLQKRLEGSVIEKLGLVIAVIDAEPSDVGKIFYKTPEVYFETIASLLVFRPIEEEIIEGPIAEVTQSDVYVTIGSIDARCPVTQLYDDKFHYDVRNKMLRGRNSKLIIKVGDKIRAKIRRTEFRIPQIIPPLRRGLTIVPPIEIRQKSEIRILLNARETGLGPLKVLKQVRKDILKSI
ncbi:MAG: RPB7/RPC8 family DNA-directed RNA polymerase subunit [Candidatus Njordarchaeales archaeon]